MGLMTSYEFNETEDRNKSWGHMKDEGPKVLIGSPSCNDISALNYMTIGEAHVRYQNIIQTKT